MPTLEGNKLLLHPFFLIGRACSIFQQRMDGPTPSAMDIKLHNTGPIYCLQLEKVSSLNGERLHTSYSQEKTIKIQNAKPQV